MSKYIYGELSNTQFLEWLDRQEDGLALDIETAEDVVIGIGIGTTEAACYFTKADCITAIACAAKHVLQYNRKLVMHAGGTDVRGMRKDFPAASWPLEEWNVWDTMVAASLFNYPELNLNYLAWEITGEGVLHDNFKSLIKEYKVKDLEGVPEHIVAEYNLSQITRTWALYKNLEPRIRSSTKLQTVFDVEMRILPLLTQMEENGVLLDLPRLAELRERYSLEGQTYQEVVAELTHGGIKNVNSPAQVSEWLFDVLGHPIVYKTKSGKGSTDERVLKKIAAGSHSDDPRYKFIRPLLHARQTLKLVGTYCDGLAASVDSGGRSHTQFSQVTADTGRLASREPNHQNIPKRRGPEIRRCFVAQPGYVLVAADMDQLELRIIAEEAGEVKMQEAFHGKRDIHQEVADELGLARFPAKILNYTIVYMAGPQQIADQMAVSKAKAEMWQSTYFRKYYLLTRWIKQWGELCAAQGYVETWLGRRRDLTEYFQEGVRPNVRQEGIRKAVNTRIQGTAAEIMKLGMLRVEEKLRSKRLAARQLIQIHDEILLEVPITEILTVAEILSTELSTTYKGMPLPCTLKVGDNWGDVSFEKLQLIGYSGGH